MIDISRFILAKGDFDLGLNIYSPDTMDKIIKGGNLLIDKAVALTISGKTPLFSNDNPLCDSKTILRKLGGMEVLQKQE